MRLKQVLSHRRKAGLPGLRLPRQSACLVPDKMSVLKPLEKRVAGTINPLPEEGEQRAGLHCYRGHLDSDEAVCTHATSRGTSVVWFSPVYGSVKEGIIS